MYLGGGGLFSASIVLYAAFWAFQEAGIPVVYALRETRQGGPATNNGAHLVPTSGGPPWRGLNSAKSWLN